MKISKMFLLSAIVFSLWAVQWSPLKTEVVHDDLFPPSPPESRQDTVFHVAVEELPEPIGGLSAIQKNVIYPEIVRRAGIEGTVSVEAFIDEAGNVVRTQIFKGVHPALDKAAVQAIEMAKFRPGKVLGKPVKVRLSIPVRFRVSAKGETAKHTLYPGNYPVSAGAIDVPESAEWRAMNTEAHRDKVLLVLEEQWSDMQGFWSVMSYLTAGEALKLAEQLQKAARSVKK